MSTFSVFVFSKEVCNAQPTYIKINLKQANTMSILDFKLLRQSLWGVIIINHFEFLKNQFSYFIEVNAQIFSNTYIFWHMHQCLRKMKRNQVRMNAQNHIPPLSWITIQLLNNIHGYLVFCIIFQFSILDDFI